MTTSRGEKESPSAHETGAYPMTAPVDFTDEGLRRMHAASVFLESPADEVVRACVEEIRRLSGLAAQGGEDAKDAALDKLLRKWEADPFNAVGTNGAYAVQVRAAIAKDTTK